MNANINTAVGFWESLDLKSQSMHSLTIVFVHGKDRLFPRGLNVKYQIKGHSAHYAHYVNHPPLHDYETWKMTGKPWILQQTIREDKQPQDWETYGPLHKNNCNLICKGRLIFLLS